MIKWKLIVKTLPLVMVMVALALIRDYILQFKGIIEFSDVSPLLSAVALIIGFMLAGVLSDFKESEKIPGTIASALEAIGDSVHVAIDLNKDLDVSEFRPRFGALICTVEDWFAGNVGVNECYTTLEEFREIVAVMDIAAGSTYSSRCLAEMNNLRQLITRVNVIAQTSFIKTGYALLDLLAGSTIVLLLISNYHSAIAEYVIISLLSLIYIYLIYLIRDIDNPFDYGSKKGMASTTEVDPFPLREYRRRFETKQE